MFKIFLFVLFLILKECEFFSYVDDSSLFDSGCNSDGVMSSLQKSSKKPIYWFFGNQMQSNTRKCHLLVSIDESVEIQIRKPSFMNTTCEEVLVVKTDFKLTLTDSFDNLIKALDMLKATD